VVQFLGLQYATLEDAFARPVLKSYDKNVITQAFQLGPQVIANPDGPRKEQDLIQHTLDIDTSGLTASDTSGLNLNVTIPFKEGKEGKEAISQEQKLPVFVFIHGGGFGLGSATWPQYDFARIVKLSKESKKVPDSLAPHLAMLPSYMC
jgi:carboxylesterase type B